MAFSPPASPQEQSPCSFGEQGQALLWTQGVTHHVSHWWVCTPGQYAELLGELLALIPGGAAMLRHSLALHGADQQRQQQGSTPQDPHGFLPVGFVLHRALCDPCPLPLAPSLLFSVLGLSVHWVSELLPVVFLPVSGSLSLRSLHFKTRPFY